MDTTSSSRRQRAAQRAGWPIRCYSLDTQPDENLSDATTGPERLSMMWDLARRAWLLSGRPISSYERSSSPGRVIRAAR